MGLGLLWSKPGNTCFHAENNVLINLSSHLVAKGTQKFSLNILFTSFNMEHLNEESNLNNGQAIINPLTSNLLNNALDWSTGSIIPNPPLEWGKVITIHFTLDRALPSVLPDHKKLCINLRIFRIHDLENIQHEKTYHVEANKT